MLHLLTLGLYQIHHPGLWNYLSNFGVPLIAYSCSERHRQRETAVTATVLNFVWEGKRQSIAMKWRDHVFKKVNKICILSALITDLWLFVKRERWRLPSNASDFQIQTTPLSSIVLHILSNERPGGVRVQSSTHYSVRVSQRVALGGWEAH